MPDVFSYTFKTESALRGLAQLGARRAAVERRVVQRTAHSVKTAMTRSVSADLGLRVSTVREEVKVVLRGVGAEPTVATIGVSGRRLSLAAFDARGPRPSRGRGRGVSYRIGSGGRKRLANAFILRFASGHEGVFERSSKLSRRSAGAWSRNLPIVEKFGPSLPHVFGKYIPLGIARAEEQLVKNLEHELQFALSQGG